MVFQIVNRREEGSEGVEMGAGSSAEQFLANRKEKTWHHRREATSASLSRKTGDKTKEVGGWQIRSGSEPQVLTPRCPEQG